jgi:uroporphyrinogen decarboxylase
MYSEPEVWRELASKLASVVRDYLTAQIEAGAQAVQLFDSWVGALSPEDYREFALPYSRSVLSGLADSGVPVIHFATGTAGILKLLRQAGGDVVGLDWRIDLDTGWDLVGRDLAVQGNLDPHLLFAPLEILLRRADDILSRARTHPGHIFNLGHGILPATPVENVEALIEHVHRVTTV